MSKIEKQAFQNLREIVPKIEQHREYATRSTDGDVRDSPLLPVWNRGFIEGYLRALTFFEEELGNVIREIDKTEESDKCYLCEQDISRIDPSLDELVTSDGKRYAHKKCYIESLQ